MMFFLFLHDNLPDNDCRFDVTRSLLFIIDTMSPAASKKYYSNKRFMMGLGPGPGQYKIIHPIILVSIVKGRRKHGPGSCCCVKAGRKLFTSFFTAFIRCLAFTTAGPSFEEMMISARVREREREMKITFQFLLTIDEASKHLDSFLWRFQLVSDGICIVPPFGCFGGRLVVINPHHSSQFTFISLLSFRSSRAKAHITVGSIMKIGINCFASDGIHRV